MQTGGEWTLRELVQRAGQALADADVRAPNGRITEVPDARVIRWYATIGVMDRPGAVRGRTALYGHRHLLQLVAIKRLQAAGLALTDIQARLTGATDAALRAIADVPPVAAPTATRTSASTANGSAGTAAPPGGPVPTTADRPTTGDGSVPGDSSVPGGGSVPADERRFWTRLPAVEPRPVLSGVPLAGGAILLLPAAPGPTDLADISAAARPLLDLLAARGLLNPTGRESHDDDR